MNINSNYNLSIYPKTNNQKSKTNPNFGISLPKAAMLPVAALTTAVVPKLMPVSSETVLAYGSPATGKKVSELKNLPADRDGFTQLHYLCLSGNLEAVKNFLDKNPNINLNQMTYKGDTCISLAVSNELEDMINLIAGMDNYNPTIPDEDGWTDLHVLCKHGYTDVVKTLLEKHPEFDINQQTKDGDTCVSIAARNKQENIINLIAGMDKYNPTIPDKKGWTDFHNLCYEGYTDVVKALLEKHPDFDINQKTKKGQTCMSLAIDNKQKDVINLIAGMDKYNPAIPDIDGWTDFHNLCYEGYTDVVKALLEKHPDFDINQKTKKGQTCLCLAAIKEQKDIVNLIAGMDKYNPTFTNKWYLTGLPLLCKKGYTDAVKTILEKHPDIDINQQTDNGYTCMSLAAINRHEEIVNLIAGMNNYNPTIPGEDGWTDLHYLCQNGYTDVVKTLLKKHPEFNINQKTDDKYTCMSLAIKHKNKDIINLIAGMDNYNPNITDIMDTTDLQNLCRFGYTDAVKTILEKHPEFDINRRSRYGSTCMSLAVWNYQKDIIYLIAGMDNYNPTIPDKYGRTDLHDLYKYGYRDVVTALLKKYPESDIKLRV